MSCSCADAGACRVIGLTSAHWAYGQDTLAARDDNKRGSAYTWQHRLTVQSADMAPALLAGTLQAHSLLRSRDAICVQGAQLAALMRAITQLLPIPSSAPSHCSCEAACHRPETSSCACRHSTSAVDLKPPRAWSACTAACCTSMTSCQMRMVHYSSLTL